MIKKYYSYNDIITDHYDIKGFSASDTWSDRLNKLYALLAEKFTGNNRIMLTSIYLGGAYLVNSYLAFTSSINAVYNLTLTYGTSELATYSMVMKSSGSSYIYTYITSAKTIVYDNATNKITGAGTGTIFYLEKPM